MFNSDKTKKCGYTGKPCTGHECMFFQQFRGNNPQTGIEEDKWECVQVMLPVLLLENSRQTRSIAAATESTRNVMQEALTKQSQHRAIKEI